MQTKSLSQIFIHFKSWVALAALTLCLVGVAVLPAAADASIFQVPDVDIHQVPEHWTVNWDPNDLFFLNGNSEYPIQGWSFVFETTGLESHSVYCYPWDECIYHNTYNDGNFILSGPDGLVFTARIVSGWDFIDLSFGDPLFEHLSFELFGFGDWNDSTHQQNTFSLTGGSIGELAHATLLLGTPEPSSLVLLGSGIVGLAGMLRRKLSR